MRINSITANNSNLIQCTPIKPQNAQKNVSFGVKPSKEALEYLEILGADMKPSLQEGYLKTPNLIQNMFEKAASDEDSSKSILNKASDTMRFYGTSYRLTDASKAEFITDHIVGECGEKLLKLLDTVDKMKSQEDKDFAHRELVNMYINGAAKNPYISMNQTLIYYNYISPFMTFKEQTFAKHALNVSEAY